MSYKKNEHNVVLFIRYSLPILILLTTIIIAFFISYEHKKNIEREKNYIEKNYIKDQKELIKSDLERVYKLIDDKSNDVEAKLRKKLKEKIFNAYSIINSIYENNKNQKTKDEILKQIKYALKDLRFSDRKGYFFLYTLEGDVLLNPLFPNLEGKNLWNYQDSKSTYIVQDMYKILKTKDETFYDWYWKDPKKNKSKEFLKVGFFKKFEPYGIFVGTGYYLDDYIDELKVELIDEISKFRFQNDRYVFIFDENDNLIVNKHKSILNENIYTSPNLKKLVGPYNEIKNSKDDRGRYFKYKFIADNKGESIEKTSYFLKFKKWDWILGSGFTMESEQIEVREKQNFLTQKYKRYLDNLYIIGSIFILFIIVISYFISKYIEKSFFKYKERLENKQKLILKSQDVAHLGDWQLDVNTMEAHWSDSVLKIFGIKELPKKVGPEFLKKIMYKDDWPCFENSMMACISTNKEHKCTYRIVRDDGSIRWIDCRGEYVASSDKVIGIIQDITERKENEIEKEKKDRLLYQQSKMAAMGEMIGNIAHQWRQPLSVISTAATGVKLKKEMGILSDDDFFETMDNINSSTQYLSQTIEDFRNFFSPDNKNFKMVSLIELFDKTFNLVSPQFISKGIKIVKNIDDIEIKTLKNELIQVLINILNNSKDALMEKKESSEEKIIIINAFEENKKLLIEIYDNAEGIDENVISRIFEPYFTTKYKSQGTGIGLYMSQEIVVKLLYGEIFVENFEYSYNEKKYKGAKFTLSIPLK